MTRGFLDLALTAGPLLLALSVTVATEAICLASHISVAAAAAAITADAVVGPAGGTGSGRDNSLLEQADVDVVTVLAAAAVAAQAILPMISAAAAAAAALLLGQLENPWAAAAAATVWAWVSRQNSSILNCMRHSCLQNWSCVSSSTMLTDLLPSPASFSLSFCCRFPWHQSQVLKELYTNNLSISLSNTYLIINLNNM